MMPATGRAQFTEFYPVGEGGVSLNNADFRLLVDTANELLRRPRLTKGSTASWRNDQTGSNGTISVTRSFSQQHLPCHTLAYETVPMATPPANKLVLNWCRTPDGSWKILS
jgi:surface antigen